MPKRDLAPVGAPCWVDLFTSEPEKSRAFYGELFGWTSEDAGPEYGGYINFSKDGIQVAGGMRNDGSNGTPDAWSVYLATENIEATVKEAEANGAQVFVPAMAVGELGSMAVMADVGGAAIGAWQPGLHKGFGVFDEPDTPAWFELQTREYDASVKFYRDVFKWSTQTMGDSPEFRYTTLVDREEQLAGIMDASGFLPDGVPSHWAIYFKVESTDAALTKITELGGAVVQPAEDTPYGRIASATDPTGAMFKLMAR